MGTGWEDRPPPSSEWVPVALSVESLNGQDFKKRGSEKQHSHMRSEAKPAGSRLRGPAVGQAHVVGVPCLGSSIASLTASFVTQVLM